MPAKKKQMPSIENVLSQEAVHAILAKRALLRAGIAAPNGAIISSDKTRLYIFCAYTWSDSAAERQHRPFEVDQDEAHLTMLASESVLRREWDSPEEDEAWANL